MPIQSHPITFRLKHPRRGLLLIWTAALLTIAVCFISSAIRYNKTSQIIFDVNKNSKSVNKNATRSNLKDPNHVHSFSTDAFDEYKHCYGELDERKLAAYLPRLKLVVSELLDPILNVISMPSTETLMSNDLVLPIVNCTEWRFHSPSGRQNYTRQQLLDIANKDDGDLNELTSELHVPNVAHFVLPIRDNLLRFHHMVCILSCAWVMRPRLMYLWYSPDRLPVGKYWQELIKNLTAAGWWESRVVMAAREPPQTIYGATVRVAEHQSDLMRLEAVLSFGGVYMDLDVVTLKSLRPLRRFPFVIGRQTSGGLCNGAFLAEPGNLFLAMWHLAYQTFDDSLWAAHSVTLPDRMCGALNGFPNLCHVEEFSMQRPSYLSNELMWIYGPIRVWDWRHSNYMVHLWYRHCPWQLNVTSVRRANSMLGDMFRYILFGSEALLP